MNKQGLDHAGRSTADMLVIIQVLIEKVMGIGGQALITFIDYSKAFDSISHVQLFDIMLELGFPEHIVTLLQSLYIYSKGSVRVQPLGHKGAALEMNRQGQGSFPPDSLI